MGRFHALGDEFHTLFCNFAALPDVALAQLSRARRLSIKSDGLCVPEKKTVGELVGSK